MLWAGILVAQENLDTTTETTTESATESEAPIDVPESAPAEKVEAHESEAVEPTDEVFQDCRGSVWPVDIYSYLSGYDPKG